MVFYYLEVIYHVVFVDESVLLDLKHLLLEAKQKIPPVLAALQADNEEYLELGGKIIKKAKTLSLSLKCSVLRLLFLSI